MSKLEVFFGSFEGSSLRVKLPKNQSHFSANTLANELKNLIPQLEDYTADEIKVGYVQMDEE